MSGETAIVVLVTGCMSRSDRYLKTSTSHDGRNSAGLDKTKMGTNCPHDCYPNHKHYHKKFPCFSKLYQRPVASFFPFAGRNSMQAKTWASYGRSGLYVSVRVVAFQELVVPGTTLIVESAVVLMATFSVLPYGLSAVRLGPLWSRYCQTYPP